MQKVMLIIVIVISTCLFWVGCDKSLEPIDPEVESDDIDLEISRLEATSCLIQPGLPPANIETVEFGENTLEFWPYTGTNFSGQPQDPINVIFFGEADPRDIRTALLSLDGDRTSLGMPPVAPFNCTWDDAVGDIQAGYGEPDGWTGSCVQLSCGDYSQPRFHIRLFKMGAWTVANAHFEVLIPGTADHQVLSWELAEQFVVADFMRSGLLDGTYPVIPTQQINDSPFRAIPDYIYNELPVELRALIEGPLEDVEGETPINTDGHALILNLADRTPYVAETRVKYFVINYGQAFPRPFCGLGEYDFVYVQGPVQMTQTVCQDENGTYRMIFNAVGELSVTPINPMTGEPVGETLTAQVKQRHNSLFTEDYDYASGVIYQKIIPLSEPGSGRLFTWLKIDSNGDNGFLANIWCGGSQYAKEAPQDKEGGVF